MYGLKGDGTAVIGINVEYVPAFYLFQPGHSSISNFTMFNTQGNDVLTLLFLKSISIN